MKTHLKKRLIRTALVAAALATSLGSVSLARAADIHLLWVQAMKDHPVHRLMQAGFLSKCKELGYTCEVVGDPSATNWDIPATLPLAEAALARTKYDAIGVYLNGAQEQEGQKVLVLYTDGGDTTSSLTFHDMLDLC